jgi:integrase
LAAALDVEVSRLFAVAARIATDGQGADGMAEGDGDNVLRGQELIERLCDSYLRRLLAEDRASRQSGDESGDVEGGLLYIAEDYAENDSSGRVEVVEEEAQALLAAEGVDLSGVQLQRFLARLLHTRVVAIKAALTERAEDGRYDPRSIQLQRPSSSSAAPPDPASLHTIGELAESYLKHQRETGAWKKGSTEPDRVKGVERFVEWLGADTPLSKVNPELCQGILEVFRDRKLVQTTQNKELRGLRALFSYGIKLEWMTRNPAKDLKVKEPPAREQRVPFAVDDLRVLLGASLSKAAIARPVGSAARGPKPVQVYMPERYWSPLLSLYAGLRAGEIVRLRADNFQPVDNVLCMSVEPEPDESLKTESSRRLVPVHSHLIELGLLAFVDEQRAGGEQHLFPRVAQLRRPVKALTTWFSRYRRSVGIDDKRKTFHSMRHNFRQALSEADVQDSVVSDLMGHADSSMTHGRYGKGASVARLRDAVERLDFRKELAALTKPTKP